MTFRLLHVVEAFTQRPTEQQSTQLLTPGPVGILINVSFVCQFYRWKLNLHLTTKEYEHIFYLQWQSAFFGESPIDVLSPFSYWGMRMSFSD